MIGLLVLAVQLQVQVGSTPNFATVTSSSTTEQTLAILSTKQTSFVCETSILL